MSSTTAASASNTVDHEDGGFACSICLRDSPTSPVLTCCGHVFCWPCIYRWLKGKRPSASLCPVCKGSLSLPPASSSSSSPSPDFTPIYVSSSSSSAAANYGDRNNPSDVHQLDLDGIPIPPRPPAHRKHPRQQAQELAAQEHQPQPIMQQQRRTAAHNGQQQQVDQQQRPRLIPEPVMYGDDHPQLMRLPAQHQQYSLAEPNFTRNNIDDPAQLQPQIFYDHWNSQPSLGIGTPALPPPAAAHHLHDQLYLLGGQQYYLNPSANQLYYDAAAQYYIGAGAVPPPPPPPPPAAAIAMRTHFLGAYSASSAPAYNYTAAAAPTGGAAHEYMSSAAVLNQLLAAEYLYAGYADATGSLNHI